MNEKDIRREVKNTLNSLDGLTHAETDPFFYTRLKARIDQNSETIIWGKRQLQWILAVLVFLLCMNVFSYVNLNQNSTENTRKANLESFASNYGWESYHTYEINLFGQ